VYFTYRKRGYKLEVGEKVLLGAFGFVIVAMVIGAFTNLTAWATRFAIDLAIILAMFAGLLVGIVIKMVRSKAIVIMISIFILACSVPILAGYCQYNSAVKPVDLEAINYVNGLSGEYFSCSPEVSPVIYEQFLNKAYRKGEFPYIGRNQPMTSLTTPNTRDYWWGNKPIPNISLDGATKFSDGELVIYVVP